MTIFPLIMLIFYIGLIFHFKSKGGYKPLQLGADGDSTGGDVDDSSVADDETGEKPEKDD